MIKKTLVGLALAATCITTASADPKIGVGMALASKDVTVRVPIDIDTKIRIEPEFSFGYTSTDNSSNNKIGLGAGLYLMSQPAKSINLYYGGKVGFVLASTSIKNGGSSSNNVFELIPTGGFEYFLHPQVSLGGEVGFRFGFGDNTDIGLKTATTLRYYF